MHTLACKRSSSCCNLRFFTLVIWSYALSYQVDRLYIRLHKIEAAIHAMLALYGYPGKSYSDLIQRGATKWWLESQRIFKKKKNLKYNVEFVTQKKKNS